MAPGDADRIRWRCRRGMLELDLILERFLARNLERLDSSECALLGELLEQPDNDLLDYALGRREPVDPRHGLLVEMMRAA